ncbi:uncharacterized protein [Diabrotica undecimpunctata]|uniref:uncharacterized protein n=1 Tax=Diabrotica undecimpunctata TaxID=50387 RepID=UPI003B63CC22
MPNIGGPSALKRRMYLQIVHSTLLYGAPVWYEALRMAKYKELLAKAQRKPLLKVASAYRTTSTIALQVITGTLPIHLLAKERDTLYNRENGHLPEIKSEIRRSSFLRMVIKNYRGFPLVSSGMASSGTGFNSLPDSEMLPPLPMGPPAIPPNRFDPYFDATTPSNVTALVGKSAYLSCRVRNLGNKTVSWIRHRYIHILTVGIYTYTSDQRFQANRHPETDDWTLQIKWAQKRDAGTYECQISTQPLKSYFVNLNVVVDSKKKETPGRGSMHDKEKYRIFEVDIEIGTKETITNLIMCYGPMKMQLKTKLIVQRRTGNSVRVFNQECAHRGDDREIQTRHQPAKPLAVSVISYDSSRGGVSVITEKGDVTTSFLLIQNAGIQDSGKYSCSPSNADVASIRVHLLNGEMPAAMQTGSAGLSSSSFNIFALIIVSYIYTSCYFSNLDINQGS